MNLRFTGGAAFLLAAAFGCGSTANPPADAGANDSGSGAIRCYPGNSNPGYDTVCTPTTQMCVNDYAGVSSLPKPNSCQPIGADCASNRTCECILKTFKCGITTTCAVEPDGMLRVVCQPD